MDYFEIEMNLLAGKPIEISGGLLVHKVSFNDMCDIGYNKYNDIVGLLCINNEKLKEYLKSEDADIYTYVVSLSYYAATKQDEERLMFLYNLINVLKYIFKKDIKFDVYNMCFAIGESEILNKENFNDFIKIVKIRNCFEDVINESDNPDSDRTKQLLERRRKLREKLNKTKSQNGDDDSCLTILDLISIYAESSHMKLEDVFSYDMYQFNNQFNRLKIFKDYEVNTRALLAGAKKEEIDFKHWLTRIDKKE
jgi:hypothetical protein